MASPRQVIFLILVRIRLPAHERASVLSQSEGSHNSDVDTGRLANRARVGLQQVSTCLWHWLSVGDSYLTYSNSQR